MVTGVYLHNWRDFIDMIGDFFDIPITSEDYHSDVPPYPDEEYWREQKKLMQEALADSEIRGIEVLLASYGYANYTGDAFVLFRKNGKLYEVNGSHCSCYGLEGKWDPEETTVESLKHRLESGRLGQDEYSGNTFKDELEAVLEGLTK